MSLHRLFLPTTIVSCFLNYHPAFAAPCRNNDHCGQSRSSVTSYRWECPSFYVQRGNLESDSLFPDHPPQCEIPDTAGITVGLRRNQSAEPTAEISISGYAHLSLYYDCNKDNIIDFLAPVLLTPGDNNPHVRLSARQSRFRIKSNIGTSVGKITTLIETDFFADMMSSEVFTNSNNLRIRIAKGEWFFSPHWSVTLGQDYSTFVNFFAFPKSVEFNSAVGTSQIRQALLRLTYQCDKFVFSVAAENPETTVLATEGGPITESQICTESGNNPIGVNDEVPDFMFRTEYATPEDFAKLQLSGTLRKHIAGTTKNGGAANGYTVGDRKTGYGLLGAVKITANKHFAFTLMAVGGDGIGRYLYDIGFGQAAIFHSDTGTLSLIHAWGGCGSVILTFNDKLKMNFISGISRARRSDLILNAHEKDMNTLVNLFWTPVKQLQFAIEWNRGKVYRIGQHPITAYRYQAAAWIYF